MTLPLLQINTPTGDETRDAIRLLLLMAGIAILSFGSVLLLGLWYLRGRDPHATAVPGMGGKPPRDLPAGLVGALVDERVDHHDIVAALFDLQRRGILSIHHAGPGTAGDDFTVTLLQPDADLHRFETPLVEALFGPKPAAGAEAFLKQRSGNLAAGYEEVRRGLYEALIERGYYRKSPEAVRERWKTVGRVVAALSVVLFTVIYALFDWTAIFPAAALFGIGIAIMRLSGAMPAKTKLGAEEAAKWRAFQADLSSIAKMSDAAPAIVAMERYLPYALALGVSSLWVNRFSGAMPVDTWAHVVRDRVAGIDPSLPAHGWADGLELGVDMLSAGARLPGIGVPSVDLPSVGAPSMESLGAVSGAAGEGMQGASDFVMGLLSAAPEAGKAAGSAADLLTSFDVGAVSGFLGQMADAAPNAIGAIGGIVEVIDAAEVLELAGSALEAILEGLGGLDF